MIPTFVFGWPTGKEEGAYLAVDLGELLFCLTSDDDVIVIIV
jgi:hexokinase